MCGICGLAYSDGQRPADIGQLRAMQETIAHRGPDGSGERIHGSVALGHRRLSIIDVAGGAQPLGNEDGSVWVSYNGEIYNYRELSAELTRAGHRFRTRSDTEVLVHGYEEHGLGLPGRLNGIFAFAIHDARRGRVLLARDHLGVKPLFYAVTPEGLFFGSEIKAVLAGAGIPAVVRSESLAEYLTFRYVAGARTFYEGIHRLPPGHLAVWESGRLRIEKYWSLPRAPRTTGATLEDSAEALDAHLGRSVAGQMMSDVPLGTFCSGGVDSGLVTGYAAGASDHPLHTFSVGLEEAGWDESALARDTASRFGTVHHTVTSRPADFFELLPELIHFHDEPLSHPNSVPLFQLSRLARQHVTVALTGEGADELFGGYPRYHIARLNAAAGVLPAAVRRALALALGAVPGHRAARVAELLPLDLADALIHNSAYVHPVLVSKLLGGSAPDALAERRRLLSEAHVPGDAVATLARYEMSTYLGCALDRMDRMSMAVGLEGRVPFLDVPLVEWGIGVPSKLKIAGRENKRVVKRLAERTLSPAITRGAKSGFGLPLGAWFRRREAAPLIARLRDSGHPATAHFDRPTLASLLDQHLAGSADHGEVIWLLANVYLWYEGQSGAEAPRRVRGRPHTIATAPGVPPTTLQPALVREA